MKRGPDTPPSAFPVSRDAGEAHTDVVPSPAERSIEWFDDLMRLPSAFTPPALTALRENLAVLQVAGRIIQSVPRRAAVDPDRVPVLVVPGFAASDLAMAPMAEALKHAGHSTWRSGIGPNIGCTLEVADALEKRLEIVAERTERRVAIVGWSRGGTLGKIVAVRRPDLVEALITLGTPNTHPLAVSTTLQSQIHLLTRLHALGVPGLLDQDCLTGECARTVMSVLAGDFPEDIPYVSVFSLEDGVIDWRACLDPSAEHVEVGATHMGMGADPEVVELVVSMLAPREPRQLAA